MSTRSGKHVPDTETYPAGLRPFSLARNERLRGLLTGGDLVIAPGAFDCITARLVNVAGFPAVYVTGSGLSMSALGAPDVALMSFAEVLDRTKRICDVVTIPVIADADTGYGGPLNIVRTVREFERAGVSAIQLEDQTWPKKCGHELGRRLVIREEMVARIKAAADARTDEDLVIIARTDARTDEGIEAAIDRAVLYGDAGADVLFVESPESEQEMRLINRRLALPTLANMVEGGRTPLVPAARLREIGYRIVIYPNALTRLIGRMGLRLLKELQEKGTTTSMQDAMMSHGELWALFEYDKWIATEQRLSRETTEERRSTQTGGI
jgi:2-methylisocitrate lyase-like PEP mutase family enzyme